MMEETRRAREIASAVAKYLGEGWRANPGPDDAGGALEGPGGERLFLRVESYGAHKGKVSVTGSENRVPGYEYGEHSHLVDRTEIRVNPSRGAAVIAREIERRLLPAHRDALARVTAAIAKTAADREAAADVGHEFARTLGSRYDPTGRRSRGGEVRWPGEGYGGIEVGYDGSSASIELHAVPVEVMRDVVAALAKHVGKG